VLIPRIFQAMNIYRIYKSENYAREDYASIGVVPWLKNYAKADACIECGVCEEHCPQHIEIRKQLKECHAALAG